MKKLIDLIKSKLNFCIHDYERYSERLIDFGMSKILYLECKKCGKRKLKII